jgi:hypothetical protein
MHCEPVTSPWSPGEFNVPISSLLEGGAFDSQEVTVIVEAFEEVVGRLGISRFKSRTGGTHRPTAYRRREKRRH